MSEEYVVERVNFYNGSGIVDSILELQRYLPDCLQQNRDNIISNLSNRRYINMVIRDSSGKVLCYALAVPQDQSIVREFSQDDPLMPVDPDRYYIDQVVSSIQLRRGYEFFRRIVHSVFQEANKAGIFKFSVHALNDNGVAKVIARVFREGIYLSRKVAMPSYGNLEYTYMEAFFGPERRKSVGAFWRGRERRVSDRHREARL